MYRSAKVKAINNDGTVLLYCGTEACNGCKARLFCNNRDQTEFLARNDRKLELSEDDSVEVFLPPGKTVAGTALVFALPLALFPAGYLLVRNLTPANELLCALGGLGAMVLAFGIAAVISIKNKRALMPVVTKME